MTLSTIDRPATDENIEKAGFERLRGGFYITLAKRRRGARSSVRLYRDANGTPFVRDRLYGRRDIVAIRFIVVDGVPLNCGCAVLSEVE